MTDNYIKRRSEIIAESRKQNQQKRQEMSFEQLKQASKKRFQTVFVGAIDKIEQYFGELWGSDEIDEENMTPTQLKYYHKFLELRTKIFDQGNDQFSKFIKDLSNYNVTKNPNRIEFYKERD